MLLQFAFFFFSLFLVALADDPDEGRTIQEIVRSHGFDLEEHSVTTQDGYILTMHRLVDGGEEHRGSYKSADKLEQQKKKKKKPVILQHGIFGSSANFLISSPFLYSQEANYSKKTGDNLGFALHLTGRYDVWLGNSR